MIEKLHNIANTILGIEDIKMSDTLFRFIIINKNEYIIKMYDTQNSLVLPTKIKRNNTSEYVLSEGTYYLRVYEKENNELNQIYFEEIYVSTDMYSRIKTMKL